MVLGSKILIVDDERTHLVLVERAFKCMDQLKEIDNIKGFRDGASLY